MRWTTDEETKEKNPESIQWTLLVTNLIFFSILIPSLQNLVFFFFETFAPPIYIHMFQKIEILSPDPGVVLIGLKKSFPIIALLIFGAG